MIILYYKNQIYQNDESRLPVVARSLRPDCSTINLAESSDQPKDWLLHPTGITFKLDAKLKTFKGNFPFTYANPAEITKF